MWVGIWEYKISRIETKLSLYVQNLSTDIDGQQWPKHGQTWPSAQQEKCCLVTCPNTGVRAGRRRLPGVGTNKLRVISWCLPRRPLTSKLRGGGAELTGFHLADHIVSKVLVISLTIVSKVLVISMTIESVKYWSFL